MSTIEATRATWDSAAAGWHRHAKDVRIWLRQPTAVMIDLAGISPGQRVLDIAAGAGDQTLDIAARVGPAGHVTATDISPAILAFAASAAAFAGYRTVETLTADAASLPFDDAQFDAAVCRLGLMFLPNPLAGVAEAFRTLKPGARFAAMVFDAPDLNPCLAILIRTALHHAGLPPRDPFQPGGLTSLGKPGLLHAHFRDAGFRAIATTRLDAPFVLASTSDYLTFVQDAAGPILQILAPLPPKARADAWADIGAQLDAFQTANGWCGPNSLLLTVGTR